MEIGGVRNCQKNKVADGMARQETGTSSHFKIQGKELDLDK